MQAIAGGEGQVRHAAEDVSFLRRVFIPELLRIDELIAHIGRQAAHLADGAIDGLAAVG